jgi:hypothetical protein
MTALHYAAENGNYLLVDSLINKISNKNVYKTETQPETNE